MAPKAKEIKELSTEELPTSLAELNRMHGKLRKYKSVNTLSEDQLTIVDANIKKIVDAKPTARMKVAEGVASNLDSAQRHSKSGQEKVEEGSKMIQEGIKEMRLGSASVDNAAKDFKEILYRRYTNSMGLPMVLPMCYLCVTYVLPMCYLCVTYALPMCYLCVTYVLPMCYLCVTYVLPMCYLCVTYALPMCYLCVTYVLPMCYSAGVEGVA